jgi:hypothetical protein
LEKLHALSQKVQDTPEEKLGATECEVGMWKCSAVTKKFVFDTE